MAAIKKRQITRKPNKQNLSWETHYSGLALNEKWLTIFIYVSVCLRPVWKYQPNLMKLGAEVERRQKKNQLDPGRSGSTQTAE